MDEKAQSSPIILLIKSLRSQKTQVTINFFNLYGELRPFLGAFVEKV